MKKRAGVPCDKDCFHCKFSDCIYDRLDAEDYAQSSERDKDMSRSPAQKKVAAQQRAYREKNREKVAAQKRAYYAANREKVAAQQRAYYAANREKVAAQQRAYREANKDKRRGPRNGTNNGADSRK